jgi:3-hydroxyacyl-[acyl-carrier-protein] dehydratase
MSEVLNIEEIKKIIPHRYPFLLVDRVTEIQGNESIKGYKNITINEALFQGHFPERAVFPGVLIIEAMAQLGAILMLQRFPGENKMALFAAIEKARFRRMVIPGDRLDMEVKVLRDRGSFAVVEAKAFVGDEIAAEARLSSSIVK